MNDLRFAFRQLLKNPAFTVVAVLTLAVGIGANTAIFSVIHAVLLKPLPYPHPERLVTLWERNPQKGLERSRVSGPNYLDWKAQNTVFESMAVSPGWQGVDDFNLIQRDGVVKVKASYVSASFFGVLGTPPLLGRTFVVEEDVKGGNRVAVVSHRLWQVRFGGSANVIGQTLTLDTYGRREYTIVGVMPPGFGVPGDSELWLPLGWMGVVLDERRSAHWHHVTARLKPGVTLEQAGAEMNMIQARLAQTYPEALIGMEVSIVPLLRQAVGGNLETALAVLSGVVAGVLLIACANVANLLLARAAGRRREIAIRIALGASRGRVLRQLLVESLVLAVLGGAFGVLLAFWALPLIVAGSPANTPRLQDVKLEGATLAWTAAISALSGLLFGLAPAWQNSRPDLNETLKEIGRGASAGRTSHRLRHGLVVAEVALSLTLLIGAGLMLRSLARLILLDRGFQPEHLVTAQLDYSVSGFTTWVQPTATRPQVTQRELMERLRRHPEISAAAVVWRLPRQQDGAPGEAILIEGRPSGAADELPRTDFNGISPDYFRAMGAPLLRGRDFTESDQLIAPQVAIVNQAFVRRYFPNENPLGKRLAFPDRENPRQPARAPWQTNGPWREIVGVVADMKNLNLEPTTAPQTFVPYWQWPMQSPILVVRATNEPAAVAALIRNEIKAVIPNLPEATIRSMDDILADTVAQPKFQAKLLGLFGVIALGLATVGLYGVLAYAVTQRSPEIGIRMALGAQKHNVLSLIIRQGMRLALAGVALGLLASLAFCRVLRSLLYEVTPTDPLTFAGVSLLLSAVALLACWLPARRAARLNPVDALRCE